MQLEVLERPWISIAECNNQLRESEISLSYGSQKLGLLSVNSQEKHVIFYATAGKKPVIFLYGHPVGTFSCSY
ncbi:hypothetical protein REPUB_Repub04eG0079900 [Reevesia pubescens]